MLRCNICGRPATVLLEQELVAYEILDAEKEIYGHREFLSNGDSEAPEYRCDECMEHLDEVVWEDEHRTNWQEKEE